MDCGAINGCIGCYNAPTEHNKSKDFASFAKKHGHARSGGGHEVLMDAVIETVRSETKDLPKLGGKACLLP